MVDMAIDMQFSMQSIIYRPYIIILPARKYSSNLSTALDSRMKKAQLPRYTSSRAESATFFFLSFFLLPSTISFQK